MVTGQVARVTPFEKGLPLQHARTSEGWEPDPWVWDDQAVVLSLGEKGLVILSGCSHAGVINVLRHAQAVTGTVKVHAVVGGLHLTGGIFEPIIPETFARWRRSGPISSSRVTAPAGKPSMSWLAGCLRRIFIIRRRRPRLRPSCLRCRALGAMRWCTVICKASSVTTPKVVT